MSLEIDTPKPDSAQQSVIAALIQGATISAAAKASRVHRTTVHYWCRTQPHFRLALEQAKQIHAESVRDELRQLSRCALTTLSDLMTNRWTVDSVRLRAVLRVIDASTESPAVAAADPEVTQAQFDAACRLIGEAGLRAALPVAQFRPDSSLSSRKKKSAA